MVPALKHVSVPHPAPSPVIGLIRLAALECRATPRHAVEACAVLAPDAGAEDYVIALVRALQGAADRRMVFWRPGAPDLSFDEAWLQALVRAYDSRDVDSQRFLLTRRLRPSAVPIVRLLLRGLVDCMPRDAQD
ncbi:hypothetical protein [Jannaschia sp. 2305UL9-9]|uniref:hypothetical protein n=1 Tax=Jannaschia sp. 2305UL9-9 TaxID=3121638 RepID=UPI0035272A2F